MNTIPILNIAQFDKEESLDNFYSNDLKKHLQKNAEIFHKPHKHDFFLCVLFLKGSGRHEIDFNSYKIEPGSVFFLMPGQTHYWKFDDEPEGYIFFHSQEFYELFFLNRKPQQFPFYYTFNNPPYLTVAFSKRSVLEAYFREIYEEYQRTPMYHIQKIASLVNLVYIELSRLYVTEEVSNRALSPTYLQTLATLEKLIAASYKVEKSAKFYANKLGFTAKHLNRITKTTLNKTTTDLITERLILEAKRLIVHSENPLSHIAEELGYEDYAYFSRVFKQKTNTTPLAFKKDYRLLKQG